jgi:hypothetical protein
VILSRLEDTCDFLTASASALSLVLEALDGIERRAQPQPHADFGRLREEFLRLGALYPRGPLELRAWVLRLSDSFRTSPATEWAGVPQGGGAQGIPRAYVLSHLHADRVVCVLQGPSAETFHELADRAGALLPCWPSSPYPALLNDVGAFARYCDPARFPWAIDAGDGWNRGMVTDHRGNVERWLGVAFAQLMRDRLEHFNFTTCPEDVALTAAGGPVNAVMTLREMNPFSACARAIEMAGLVPQQTLPADLSAQAALTTEAPPMASAGQPVRVRCDESDRSIYLDGKRVAEEMELAVFRFFRAIVGAYPDPISYRKIANRVPGLLGKHPTRDLKGRLPTPLAGWVRSGKHGYCLKLPPPKSSATVHTS